MSLKLGRSILLEGLSSRSMNFNISVHPNTLMEMVSEMVPSVGITHQVLLCQNAFYGDK